ncbi:hypothetical protein [Rickettsia australis]|uniref:Uncharacterized protein n=1 Tax=Rickettsia australis (strain Cutlack) TaxID=1105110 RepID=H8K9Q6_RICAC|nr:hypothetical protein [Rickettsia australis]AFC70776.1 hypothetical protein MC5_01945 [Rickettsia australis str. Cutlack]
MAICIFYKCTIALVIIAFGIVWIPESSNHSNEPWDWIGVFQSFFGIAALVQGIKIYWLNTTIQYSSYKDFTIV